MLCEEREEQRAEAGLILGPESSGKIWRALAGGCSHRLAGLGGWGWGDTWVLDQEEGSMPDLWERLSGEGCRGQEVGGRVLCENNRDRVWLGARGPQSSSPITVI